MSVVPRFIPTPINSANNVAAINQNFDNSAIAQADSLSRSGAQPNAMGSDLDMNHYNILNQGNVVTIDSFNWRGNWQTATAYNVGDTVFFGSTSYICVVANTSAAAFITDLLLGKWQNVDQGIRYRGAWAGPGTGYFVGDIVLVSPDALYTCLVDNVSSASFSNDLSAGYWTVYGGPLGSMAIQNASAIAVTGGTLSSVAITSSTINATPIGQSSPSTGIFVGSSDQEALRIIQFEGEALLTFDSPTISQKFFIGMTEDSEDALFALSATGSGLAINGTTGIVTCNQGAFDSGSPPTSPPQLTNKAYVDALKPTIVSNANGVAFIYPNGFIEQWGTVTVPAAGSGSSNALWTFPTPFLIGMTNLHFQPQDFSTTARVVGSIPENLTLTNVQCTLVCDSGNILQTPVYCYAFGK